MYVMFHEDIPFQIYIIRITLLLLQIHRTPPPHGHTHDASRRRDSGRLCRCDAGATERWTGTRVCHSISHGLCHCLRLHAGVLGIGRNVRTEFEIVRDVSQIEPCQLHRLALSARLYGCSGIL